MPYCIDITRFADDCNYDNITSEELHDDDVLVEIDEFKSFAKSSEFDSIDDALLAFKCSNEFFYLLESYSPIYLIAHVLQNSPSENEIQMCIKYAPNITLLYVEEIDTYLISLNGCGMDMSDSIELAYYLIDGVSPVVSRDKKGYTISKKANFIRTRCQDIVKKSGRTCMYDIENFEKEWEKNNG